MRRGWADSADPDCADITGAILAGGRGERLGGVDKGLLLLRGRPLVERVLAAIRGQVGGMLVVANRNLAQYAALGVPVVSDLRPHFQGPLAGLETALHACPSAWLLSVPCDAVAPPALLARRLAQAVHASGAAAAYATSGEDRHYLCCLLPKHLAPQLRAAMDAGESAPRRWLAQIGAVPVDFSDVGPDLIWSINTPEDLARARAACGDDRG